MLAAGRAARWRLRGLGSPGGVAWAVAGRSCAWLVRRGDGAGVQARVLLTQVMSRIRVNGG